MATRRRKLDVQEAQAEQKEGLKITVEEGCIYVTTVALVIGIIVILIKLGADYAAGPFA